MGSWPASGGRWGEKDGSDALGVVDGRVAVSVPEARRLLALTLPLPPGSVAFHLAWSDWRRTHQGRAKRCHYARARRLAATPPDS